MLSKLETVHIEHSQEANKVSDKMNKLTDDYNSLVKMMEEEKKEINYYLGRNHAWTEEEVLICFAIDTNFSCLFWFCLLDQYVVRGLPVLGRFAVSCRMEGHWSRKIQELNNIKTRTKTHTCPSWAQQWKRRNTNDLDFISLFFFFLGRSFLRGSLDVVFFPSSSRIACTSFARLQERY